MVKVRQKGVYKREQLWKSKNGESFVSYFWVQVQQNWMNDFLNHFAAIFNLNHWSQRSSGWAAAFTSENTASPSPLIKGTRNVQNINSPKGWLDAFSSAESSSFLPHLLVLLNVLNLPALTSRLHSTIQCDQPPAASYLPPLLLFPPLPVLLSDVRAARQKNW